ncbi:hypothetical protein ACLOJK_006682, partial [Asimina triloba]
PPTSSLYARKVQSKMWSDDISWDAFDPELETVSRHCLLRTLEEEYHSNGDGSGENLVVKRARVGVVPEWVTEREVLSRTPLQTWIIHWNSGRHLVGVGPVGLPLPMRAGLKPGRATSRLGPKADNTLVTSQVVGCDKSVPMHCHSNALQLSGVGRFGGGGITHKTSPQLGCLRIHHELA